MCVLETGYAHPNCRINAYPDCTINAHPDDRDNVHHNGRINAQPGDRIDADSENGNEIVLDPIIRCILTYRP